MSSSIVSRCICLVSRAILRALLPKAKGSSCTVRVRYHLTPEADVDGVYACNCAMDGLLSLLSSIYILAILTSDIAGLKPLALIRVGP